MQIFLETECMVLRRFVASDLDSLVELDSAYHSEAEEVWNGDDVEYALTKAECEQMESASK